MNTAQLKSTLQELGFTVNPQILQDICDCDPQMNYVYADGLVAIAEYNKYIIYMTEPPHFRGGFLTGLLQGLDTSKYTVYYITYDQAENQVDVKLITVEQAESILLKEYDWYMSSKEPTTDNRQMAEQYIKGVRKQKCL